MFLLLSFISNAQTFHFSTYKANNPSGGAEFGTFDISNCSYTLIGDNNSLYLSDISFFSDGSLLTITPLVMGSLPANTFWMVDFYPNISPLFYALEGTGSNLSDDDGVGMTCGPSGNLYISGKGISVYGGGFTPPTYLGDLPPTMESQGDITYREGNFYISTVENTLVEVDLNNPMNSSVVFEFPQGTPPIHGLATVEIDCDSFITYASGLTATGSIIYEVDFINQTLIEVCQIDKFILGLASMSECFIPECEVLVDLDSDDSSGAIDNDYEVGIVCTPPVAIADADVSVFSETDIVDSIKICINNSSSLEEYLTSSIVNTELTIIGLGTSCITIVNNGGANVVDFENALANILYHNDMAPLILGTKSIEVIAYSIGLESEPAISNILLNNSEVYLNYDSTNVSCYGNAEGEITVESFGGFSPYNYQWNTNQITETITPLIAGTYQVTVTDKYGCTATEVMQITQPDTLSASINILGSLTICDSSAQLTGMGNGGLIPYQYNWNTGISTQSIAGVGAGAYALTITDQNGCESYSEFQINEGISVMVNQEIYLCEGETILIDNELYSSDTTIYEVFNFDNGCDSTHCYILEFGDIVYSNFSEEMCQGDSFSWNGELLYSDTIITSNYISLSGCDSIVELTLDVYDFVPITFSTSGSLCNNGIVEIFVNQYDSYSWSTGETTPNIYIIDEGTYNITITDSNNCEFLDEIEITNDPLEVIYQLNEPSCYGFTDGLIQIDSVIGGTAPFLYSIDNEPLQQSSLFENISSGDYLLSIEDVNGCQEELEIIINQPVESILEIQNYYEIDLGDSLELQLITNISNPNVVWEPAMYLDCDTCLNVISNPFQSVIYEIIASDINGCLTKNTVEINVDQTLDVFIPNAFSPNDDGFNDLFTIYSGASVSNINYLKIFDRWGELVYVQKNFLPNSNDEGWDGRFKNKKMLDGVYVYIVEVERVDGSKQSISGELTLVR